MYQNDATHKPYWVLQYTTGHRFTSLKNNRWMPIRVHKGSARKTFPTEVPFVVKCVL